MNASKRNIGLSKTNLTIFLNVCETSFMMFGCESRFRLDFLLPDVEGKMDEELVQKTITKAGVERIEVRRQQIFFLF